MKRQDGIALIASLLIMAAIMALGVGSLFLSTMNLRIAENSRAHALARYNAEAGLEAAMVQLKKDYKTSGKFPANFTNSALPTTMGIRYELAASGYTTYAAQTQARVVVLGTSSSETNSARYQTEAFLSSTSVAGAPSAERYGRGLVAEGSLNINGRATYTDALLHGNKGFTVNGQGTFQTCLERNAFGECVRFQAIADPDIPITAAQGENATCNFSSNLAVCSGGRPQKLVAKETVNVNYLDRRGDVIGKALKLERYRDANMQNVRDETQTYLYAAPSPTDTEQAKPSTTSQIKISGALTSAPYTTSCAKTFNSGVSYNSTAEVAAAGFTSGNVICVSGGVTFPNGTNLTGVTVIADGPIQFNGNSSVTLDKTTLISRTGAVNINSSGLTLKSTTVFSNGDLNLNGQQTVYEGDTTLASNGSINVNGSSKVTRNFQGNISIGLALIAQRDININGSSDWYATSVAGGNLTYNGSATLYGGVSAKGNITINGSFDVDSGLPISNSNLQDNSGGTTEMQVESRR